MSKLHEAKYHVNVTVDMDGIVLAGTESKAIYIQTKKYVLERTGLKVSNLYIAQVKGKHGLEKRENYSLSNSEHARQPKCPEEKEKAIEDALEHFGMI